MSESEGVGGRDEDRLVGGALVRPALVAGGLQAKVLRGQIGDGHFKMGPCVHICPYVWGVSTSGRSLACVRDAPGVAQDSPKCEQFRTQRPGWIVAVDTLGAEWGCQACVELWMCAQRDVVVHV